MNSINARLDFGPPTTLLEETIDGFCRVRERDGKKSGDSLEFFLSFSQSVQVLDKVGKLWSLLERYKALPDRVRAATVAPTVASWIHYSQQLEGDSLPTDQDTENLVKNFKRDVAGCSSPEQLVLNSLSVLRETYSPPGRVQEHIFDVPWVLKRHKEMFENVHGFDILACGSFRSGGVFTKNPDGTQHVYPHHSVLMERCSQLFNIVQSLAKAIDNILSPETSRVSYIFALAAFVQFHFVDLHPFPDGNGRICRFLSKRILDSVLPVPFPMFTDRSLYIDALVKGREGGDPRSAPSFLFSLLLDVAITCYTQIAFIYRAPILEYAYLVCSVEELDQKMETEDVDQTVRQMLRNSFESLGLLCSATVEHGGKTWMVRREGKIDFDSI
eukprot:ANDGO_02154.mRNA.1 hypothetical protein